jgi:hypothetical protein
MILKNFSYSFSFLLQTPNLTYNCDLKINVKIDLQIKHLVDTANNSIIFLKWTG